MTLRMEVRECGVNIKWGEKKTKQNVCDRNDDLLH